MAEFANGATFGYDASATVGGSPTPNYADVAEIVSIQTSISADTLDVSVHDDDWRRFVGGLANAGSATMELRFTSGEGTHLGLMGLIGRSQPFAMRIRGTDREVSSGDRWEFECDGFVTQAAPSFPHDGVASMSVQVQFSGEPIMPSGSS